MKPLYLILVLFSLINPVYAQNLCDQSCEFSATFPQGGSLEAIDELTLIFGTDGELILGTGGTVNTAIQPASLDFSSGGILTLSAGESITFGPGGSLVLGTGGNMDALSYNLTSSGDISIEAIGGSQSIKINGGWDVSGALNLTSLSCEINSTISVDTQLDLQNSGSISGSGSIINMGTATLPLTNVVTFPVGGSLEVVNESTLTYASNGELTLGSGAELTLSGGIVNSTLDASSGSTPPLSVGESVTFDPGTSLIVGIESNGDTLNYNLTTTGYVVQDLDATLNGLELSTSDGNTCIVIAPECVADDGATYVLSTEGQLVKKEVSSDPSTSGSSGSIGLPVLGLFMILLFSSGTRKTLYC